MRLISDSVSEESSLFVSAIVLFCSFFRVVDRVAYLFGLDGCSLLLSFLFDADRLVFIPLFAEDFALIGRVITFSVDFAEFLSAVGVFIVFG
jgi:hypothetical protein